MTTESEVERQEGQGQMMKTKVAEGPRDGDDDEWKNSECTRLEGKSWPSVYLVLATSSMNLLSPSLAVVLAIMIF